MSEIKKEISSEAICRLCLQERDHYRTIFPSENTALDDWIENLTSMKISYIPNAPAALCLDCETVLKNYESFREMCFSNDRAFREMFPQTVEQSSIYSIEYVVKEESDLQSDTFPDLEHFQLEVNESDATEHVAVDEVDPPTTTDQFPYQCHVCLRRFRVERNLRRHCRVHMPKMEKLQCEQCEKLLVNDTALRIHMRIHTQEKPYGCLECGQSFSTSGLLTRHVRSHNKKRKVDP